MTMYNPSKLMRTSDGMDDIARMRLTHNLRTEVIRREERDKKWRQVRMMATKNHSECGDDAEAWNKLEETSREALENTCELRYRLRWCETQFEEGALTAGEIAEERTALPDEERGEEEQRGRSMRRGC